MHSVIPDLYCTLRTLLFTALLSVLYILPIIEYYSTTECPIVLTGSA